MPDFMLDYELRRMLASNGLIDLTPGEDFTPREIKNPIAYRKSRIQENKNRKERIKSLSDEYVAKLLVARNIPATSENISKKRAEILELRRRKKSGEILTKRELEKKQREELSDVYLSARLRRKNMAVTRENIEQLRQILRLKREQARYNNERKKSKQGNERKS